MPRMFSLLVVMGVVCPAFAEELELQPKSLDAIVATAMQKWQAPGVALVVVHDDRVIHSKGYGTRHVQQNEPITADTLFPLASCTKAFTTTLLAMLVDDGKLAWDDPVRKHLPTFHLSEPNADALVSIRDLVSHRTGVPGNDLLWYRAPWDISEVLQQSNHLKLAGPFRGAYFYNSINFMAAGRAGANAAKTPWEVLVRERICEPLGMKHVAFTSEAAAKFTNRASGHRRTENGTIEPMPEYLQREPNPAGSLFASANDVGAWLRFQLAHGKFDGERLVSDASLGETHSAQIVMPWNAEMRAVYPDSRHVCYAMGWVTYDHRGELVVAHGGVIDGFRVQVTLLPERNLGFAQLNNLHETKMNIAIGNTIIDHALKLEPRDWNTHFLRVETEERTAKRVAIAARDAERVPNTQPSLPLPNYAGEYTDAAYSTGRIVVENNRMAWKWSSFTAPLEHYQNDTFRVTSGYFAGELVTAHVKDGRVIGVDFHGVRFVRK